jgi:hypothetical protein
MTDHEKDDIVQRNPRIEKNLVQGYEKLEKELEKIGVSVQPQFSLSPPLGNLGCNNLGLYFSPKR